MPWFLPGSDFIKKRACRYLLQHYVGQFLKEKLTVDQLTVDLYQGTGTIKDVLLDVASLNAALDMHNVPVEIVDGFIGSITVNIPWSALINDNTCIQIHNLELTIQPRQRAESPGVMLDSMLSSMTTSLQLAQECLKQDPSEGEQTAESAQPFEGLESFAQTIEAVLSQVKMTLVDTVVRLEHLPVDAQTGAALELRVARVDYFDDQATNAGSSVDSRESLPKSVYKPAAIAHKNFHLVGLTLFCDEFPARHRTMPKNMDDSMPFRMRDGSSSPPYKMGPSNLDASAAGGERAAGGPSKELEPITIAVLTGRQELKVKIKQKEELPGPKLEFDAQFGSINAHLSPRQLHLIINIASGLSTPGMCDQSNTHGHTAASKPMQPDDYHRVESELQKELQSGRLQQGNSLGQGLSGWSSSCVGQTQAWVQGVGSEEDLTVQPLEDSDDESYYDLSESAHLSMEGSVISTATNKSSGTVSTASYKPHLPGYARRESPFQATIPRAARARQRAKHKDTMQKLIDDPSAELTQFKVKVSFLSLMLLHEDPPETPGDMMDPGLSSETKLREMAKRYFGRVKSIVTSGTNQSLPQLREEFSKACIADHISVLCKPVMVDISQKVAPAGHSMMADITVGLAEVVEAVFDRRGATASASILGFHLPIETILPEYCLLLTFSDGDGHGGAPQHGKFSTMPSPAAPCVRLHLHSYRKLHKTSRRLSGQTTPRTDVHLELAPHQTEIDITLVDRIHALLTPRSLSQPPATSVYMSTYKSVYNPNAQLGLGPSLVDSTHGNDSDSELDVRLSCQKSTFTIRFPIPDLRAGQASHQPWWRRNLHKESLILQLDDADLRTTFTDGETCSRVEFTCRDGHGFCRLGPEHDPIPFLRISHGDTPDMTSMPHSDREDGFDWPRLVLKIMPAQHTVLEEAAEDSEDSTPQDSLNGACQFNTKDSSPFSSRKVMYDNEEMVMPGDRQEMGEFIDKSSSHTRLHLDISLPNVNIRFPDKDFFEILYNRLLNDLLLWEPSAPAPLDPQEPYSLGPGGPGWSPELVTRLMQHQQEPHGFSTCKSGTQYDSTDESDEEEHFRFYSVSDGRQRHRQNNSGNARQPQQSKMCVNVSIGRGQLLACTAVRDDGGHVISEHHGELLISLEDGNVFVEVCHNGDPDLQYICVQAHKAALYHCSDVILGNAPIVIERVPLAAPPHFSPTIYLSGPGLTTSLSGQVGQHGTTNDMLSLAVRVQLDTFRHLKDYQVSLGLRGATLRHRPAPSGHAWYSQLIDFFSAKDYEVLGYTPPSVLTALHLHVWGSAIDFRPRFLPYCAIVVMETFSISSNIAIDSPSSLLRFLIDDGALYMSEHTHAKEVNLRKNYVCVLDVGLFELCLRSTDGKDNRYPKTDLRAKNNIVHIRTCSDSCHALGELIQYIVGDGDLANETASVDSLSLLSQSSSSVTLSESPVLSQSRMDHVNDLMADAMYESPTVSQHSSTTSPDTSPEKDLSGPTQLFFLPKDGNQQMLHRATGQPAWEEAEYKESPPMDLMADAMDDSASDMSESMSDSLRSLPQKSPHTPSVTGRHHGSMSVSYSAMQDSVRSDLGISSPPQEPEDENEDVEGYSDDNEFCIIDEPGLGIGPRDGEAVVRPLVDTPIQIMDNHFIQPLGRADQLRAPDHFPCPVYKYCLAEMSLVWYMYGGTDFEKSPAGKFSLPAKSFKKKADESLRLGRVGWQASGGPGRNIDVLMELQLNKIRLQHETYPETTLQASRQILLIQEVEMRDRLLASRINKFLYQYTSDKVPRQSHANMVLLKLVYLRPDLALPTQEALLRISLQPLKLNVDQDAMFFLRSFFTDLTATSPTPTPPQAIPTPGSGPGDDPKSSPQQHRTSVESASSPPAPVMSVAMETSQPLVSPDLLVFDEIAKEMGEGGEEDCKEADEERDKPQPTFFKSFIFSPDVPIRLDYHGKRVDMEQGTLAGLLVGLAHLNCSELKLKRIHHRHGILGWERLLMFARKEWLNDITKNQLPSILGGVGPMHSMVQLVQGIKDFFWLPVEQYRKDGRIVRGLQRGTQSFFTCTAMSALELTNRLVQVVQVCAEVTHDIVSPGPSLTKKRKVQRRQKRLVQPSDMREGISNAYSIVRQGVLNTAETIYSTACSEKEQKGMTGAVGGVLRQIPPTVLQPIIITAEATSNVLGGMRNQLLPDRRKEEEEKWKEDES